MYEAIFNGAGNRMHPHDFVHSWFVLLDLGHSLIDQFLDQLRARGPIFDQDHFGTKSRFFRVILIDPVTSGSLSRLEQSEVSELDGQWQGPLRVDR